MPYIEQSRRDVYEESINNIVNEMFRKSVTDENAVSGELNYIIFSIMKRYVKAKGKRYFRMQNLLGALDCCSKEFYRKVVAPYEDEAIEKNGDV